MKKQSLLMLSLVTLFFVSSCKKKADDPIAQTQTLSAADAKAAITSESATAEDDIIVFTQSEGAESVASLSKRLSAPANPLPFGRIAGEEEKSKVSKLYHEKTQAFRNTFLPSSSTLSAGRVSGDGAFDFETHKGVYEWDNTKEDFVKTSEGGAAMIIHFPSDTTKPTINDATLTISSYSEEEYIDNSMFPSDTTYNPTKIVADLKVSSVTYVSVDFTAAFNPATGDPTAIDYTLFLKPYTNTATFRDNGASITFDSKLTNGGTIVALGGTVAFTDNNKETPKTGSGYVQYRNLKLTGSVNAEGMKNDTALTEAANFNKNVAVDLVRVSDNAKIGKIELMENATTNEVMPIVRYENGTYDELETLFADAINEVEDYYASLE